MEGFELDGRDVADARVKPTTVVPPDPSGDRELELIAGLPDAVGDQLGLEGVHEGLGERVGESRQLRSMAMVSSDLSV